MSDKNKTVDCVDIKLGRMRKVCSMCQKNTVPLKKGTVAIVIPDFVMCDKCRELWQELLKAKKLKNVINDEKGVNNNSLLAE